MVRKADSSRRGAVLGVVLASAIPAAVGLTLLVSYFAHADLPPVPVPAENPLTEEKRVLGKILFWDEQLSTDNTVACGTCHMPERAGVDPRIGIHPGLDGITPSPDDRRASPGVVSCDIDDNFLPSELFVLQRQVTDRAANSMINAAYSPELFWDGRAPDAFKDPQTGAISIPAGAALESQAVAPPTSSVEMAHAGREWNQIAFKLQNARPLAIATNLPADVASALQPGTTYPELFTAAFGDGAITADRIAKALATYQRTLISDESAWDRFMDGDLNAMTPAQQRGWQTFQAQRCVVCHTPPLFTDHSYRNLGLRPIAEDIGREAVSGDFNDAGRFKVPGLRNAALKPTFMHNGQFTTLPQVMGFYANGPGTIQFPDNQDPLMSLIVLPPPAAADVTDFIANALLDPRVQAGQFPFDRPTLRSQTPPNPALVGTGVPGTGGLTPTMIAVTPPNLGNPGFKLGVTNAAPGRQAFMAISSVGPVNGRLQNPEILAGPYVLDGDAPNRGYGTFRWPVPDDAALDGKRLFMQWMIVDPGAVGGFARSPVARVDLFCGRGICPSTCLADLTGPSDPADPAYGIPNGEVDGSDFFYYLDRFASDDLLRADLTATSDPASPVYGIPDGQLDASDFFYFLDLFEAGCP